MASEDDKPEAEIEQEDQEEDDGKSKAKKPAKYDSGAADLERVTDYVEEAEISSQNIESAVKMMHDKQTHEASEKQRKEKELSRVKIKKEDVDLIAVEMEITRTAAERTLREHKGNIVEALVALTN